MSTRARMALATVVAIALAVAPISGTAVHAGPPHDAITSDAHRHQGAASHHPHGPAPEAGGPDAPAHGEQHDAPHCVACLVGAWAAPPMAGGGAGSSGLDASWLRRGDPHVGEEHHRHTRSRAPPPGAAAG